jgi:hypothetical protein
MNYLQLVLRTSFIALASITVSLQGFGQTSTETKPSGYLVTANASVGKNEQTLAFSGLYNWRVAFKNRFKVGLGVRSSHYFGQNQYFETAPAKFTTNQEGPQVLFVPSVPGNIDSLKVGSAYVHSLNLMLNLEFAITPKWDIGTNIDLIGFSFGSANDISHISSYYPVESSPQFSAKASFNNLLLISDNDKGSLNSEFYGRYHLNDRWAINGGATFIFSELQTSKGFDFGNDLFRRKAFLGTVGVSWYPFR